MRFTRSFLVSLGASVSLIAAGSLALLAVSTVVAFNGWPGVSVVTPAGSEGSVAAVPAPGARKPDAGADDPIVMAAAPVRKPVVERPAPAPRRTSTRVVSARPAARPAPREVSVTAPARLPEPEVPEAWMERRDATPPPAPEPPPPPRPADGVRQTTDRVGSSLGETVGALGDVVAPLSPALDASVDHVGDVVHNTVAGVGEALAALLEGLLAPPPRAP